VPTAIGAHHPQLAAIRELHEARTRRERATFFFEGPILLEEALRSALRLDGVFATDAAYERSRPLLDPIERGGIPLWIVPDRALARLSDLETPPCIIAIAPMHAVSLSTLLEGREPVLLLAGLNDPGNAGTLVRTAEAFGASKVVFGRGGVDAYHPKVIRAAMGSLFRARIAFADGDEIVAAARAAGRPIVAADMDGEPLPTARLPANAIVAVGNERHGIRAWLPFADRTVTIPHQGPAESLNAAVAGSVLLYELSIQTRRPS